MRILAPNALGQIDNPSIVYVPQQDFMTLFCLGQSPHMIASLAQIVNVQIAKILMKTHVIHAKGIIVYYPQDVYVQQKNITISLKMEIPLPTIVSHAPAVGVSTVPVQINAQPVMVAIEISIVLAQMVI